MPLQVAELVRFRLDGNPAHQGLGFLLKTPTPQPNNLEVYLITDVKEFPPAATIILSADEILERWPLPGTFLAQD